ncbi:MAG: DUF2786 domain-containing protein [Verrucomicrobia bacterium]|nr:DUF2786 domain-containing protein [Verrucomicrobiota bacterium]
MSAPAEIIEKIKKLLRLARSSNRHEAELALAHALALAREHAIAIDSLNPDESVREKQITHRDTEAEAKLTYDKRYALAICRRFFRVTTVEIQCLRPGTFFSRLGVRVMFVGTRSDIEIALYVYGFLVGHFARSWRKVQQRFRNRQAYVHGMYIGLTAKLEEQRDLLPKGTELVVAGHEQYILATVGQTTTTAMGKPDHRARAAAWAGFLEGQNTEIHGALQPASGESLALTR